MRSDKSQEIRLLAWLAGSGVLLALTVASPMPDLVRTGAVVCAAGIWVASQVGKNRAFEELHTTVLGRGTAGTLLYSWGLAATGSLGTASLGLATEPSGWPGALLALASIVLTVASWVLMAVAAAVVLAMPLALAWNAKAGVVSATTNR